MLISVKLVMEELAEGFPGSILELMLDRLVPEIGRALEVHFGNAEPHRLIDLIHGEVFLAAAATAARIFTVEFGKQKLR
jgi:hypothetical protein